MKTIIRKDTGASLYLLDDAKPVTLGANSITVGALNAPEYTIADLNEFNATLVEGITPPSDWVGDKYRLAAGAWIDMTPEREAAAREVAIASVRAQRAAEYPPMAEYLDGIVKGDQAQVQAYIDACLAVKAKYPKPE